MSRYSQLIVLLVAANVLVACGDDGKVAKDVGTDASSNVPVKEVTGEKVSDSARFDRDIRKKGCEILTAEITGATFNIPAADLKQTKILGCLYTWRSETEKVEAHLSMIQAHKTEAGAAAWFANATMNKTAEQVKADMEKVLEGVEKSEALDTGIEKTAAKGISAIFDHKAINFENVASLGSEARASDDGTVTVRVDNLTFHVSAYKGDRAPELDLKGADIKEITKLAKKQDAEWAQKTAPQRKQDGTKLAKAIVATL